mmetsp:Transcript_5681/g.21433  ORF Transcript_5681/g.21433 Transcript_5681/m.21433 type:complete len:325 (+) Transcript_5681:30-1004(+)
MSIRLRVRRGSPPIASRPEIPAVEPRETRQRKHRVVRLFLNLRAPVPRARQPPVDARSRVEEVIRPGSVEGVPEKVRQDGLPALVHAPERALHVLSQTLVLAQLLHPLHHQRYGVQDPRHLGVLVDEHEGVGDVVVAEVHHAAAHPVTELGLAPREHLVDRLVRLRRRLHAIQTLARVGQLIIPPLSQQVALGEVPELEHVVAHLPPQHHRLHDVRVLALVVVRQSRPAHPHRDPQREPGFRGLRVKVPLEKVNHAVHGVAVESQVRVVVGDGVEDAQDLLTAQVRVGVPPREVFSSLLLRLDLALHLDPRLALVHNLGGGLMH